MNPDQSLTHQIATPPSHGIEFFWADARQIAGAIHFGSQIGFLTKPRALPEAAEDNLRTRVLQGDPAARIKINQPAPPTPASSPVPNWCPNRLPPG